MPYRVTAGHIELDVDGQQTRFNRGTVLPAGAGESQIEWELNLGTIEEFSEDGDSDGIPDGMSVSATLKWAAAEPGRAQTALDAENMRPSPRATLVERLQAMLAEGESADSGTGASVDS